MKIIEPESGIYGKNRASNKITTVILQKEPDPIVTSHNGKSRLKQFIVNKEVNSKPDQLIRKFVKKRRVNSC